MSILSEQDYTYTLYGSLQTLADANDWEIVFPNYDRDNPEARNTYLKASILKPDTQVLGLQGMSSYVRILQVLIYYVDNEGEDELLTIVDGLKQAYPVMHKWIGEDGDSYQLVEPPNVITAVDIAGWHFVPMQFRIQIIK